MSSRHTQQEEVPKNDEKIFFRSVAQKRKEKLVSDDETHEPEDDSPANPCQLGVEIKSFNPLEEAMRRAVLVHTVLLPSSFYPYIRQK